MSEIPPVSSTTGEPPAKTRSTSVDGRRRWHSTSSPSHFTGQDLTSDDLPDLVATGAPALAAVHFRPATVYRLLARLDISKATGPDGISARVLKECAKELAKPLSQLFALCFSCGVQPESWKTANVVQIHKRSSRSVLKNYRPVSLLCIMSKVMETIVNRQLMNHLERQQLLTPHQFGFRRGLGTTDALQALHNAWLTSLARPWRIMPAEKLAEFGTFSGKFHACLVCG